MHGYYSAQQCIHDLRHAVRFFYISEQSGSPMQDLDHRPSLYMASNVYLIKFQPLILHVLWDIDKKNQRVNGSILIFVGHFFLI